MNILIIDYGAGNLRSMLNSIEKIIVEEKLGVELKISDKKEDLIWADKIILPGVGAYGDCVGGLRNKDLEAELKKQILDNKKKFLGVCVGMQVLSDVGFEDGTHQGLELVAGEVKKIDDQNSNLKIPHMGWNEVEFIKKDEVILAGINDKEHFYFANSYCFDVSNDSDVLGFCKYGQIINSAILKDNILALQFHPEKSGDAGLKLLSNFLKW